jgi:Flp pilus assembly protein TadD/glutathione synthase/RimK-type ligase-like ATP-grasp enzyme
MEDTSSQECRFCKEKIGTEAVKCRFCGEWLDDFEAAKHFFFEGLHLLAAKNFQAAETQFAQSLKFIPDRASTLNNLSVIKVKLKKFAEAEEFALKAVALEDKSPEAWTNLGNARAAMKRHEEALQAFDRALNGNFTYAKASLAKAKALLALKRYDEALPACDETLKLDSNDYEVLYVKSLILKELGRPDEAGMIYRKSLDMRVAASPVFISERRATQKADILIINQNPDVNALLKLNSFQALHLYCSNFPGQLAERFHEDFHFTYVFECDATTGSARKHIPQPDFVINNCVNGERLLSGGNLPGLITLVDSFGVPVVNHPTRAVQTTRDVSARLLDDIPGVVVPKTMRFFSAGKTFEELADEIEDQYDYPLITRTLTFQEGKGMTKVDSRDALVAVLASGLPDKFFVTEFVDSRGGKEFFRKIRAAVVEDEIIIIRVDYSDNWNVRGRKTEKRVPFYLEHLYLLDEEKRICLDPAAELGRPAIQSLRTIRERIPLDVFGMDLDVDADGRLVFYEANATMNLFSTAQKQVPNPKEADASLKLAFQRYFESLAARRGRNGA